MNPSDDRFAALWRELIAANLISAAPPQRLDGGNSDRAESAQRTSWRAESPDGLPLKLTVAPQLADLFARASSFQTHLPHLTCRARFHRRFGEIDVVAEDFFTGQSLEALIASRTFGPAHAASLVQLRDALTALTRRSTTAARDAEWARWTHQLLALPLWDHPSRSLLTGIVLPALADAFLSAESTLTWTHGDLIGRNILFDAAGALRLIDCEYASETHFPKAELARFHALTPGLERIAPEIASAWPAPSPAAQLHFWLQQIERESLINRPEYLTRWLPDRLARVHTLAETLTKSTIASAWRRPPQANSPVDSPLQFHLEEARWLVDSPAHALRISGWCFDVNSDEPLIAVVALADHNAIVRAPPISRPDVQAHFRGAPNALSTGFILNLPPVDALATLELAAESTSSRHVFWSCVAGDLPGRGPVHCHYSNWAEVADPVLGPSPVGLPGPRFSILLPVFNTAPELLRDCLDSVRAQHFPHWQLQVVDDASTAPHIASILDEYAGLDPRIVIHRRSTNGGISRATNDALAAASGDFVVLLDHDDILRPHALAELAARLAVEPNLDALYSDEDKLSPSGLRTRPLLKPAFSPEFLRGVMYVGHVLCIRASLAREIAGFDPAFDGIQDYEFFLRFSERTARIGHVPRILYHWRQSASSSALVANVKGDVDALQARAVQAHLERLGDSRRASALGGHRVRLQAVAPAPTTREIRHRNVSDFAQSLLAAARASTEDILLFVDERAPALSAETRSELAAVAALPDSAFVSAVLVSRDSHVLESGLTFDVNGQPVPVMNGFDATGDGLNGTLLCNREVAAVSPWCVAIRRAVLVETIGAPPGSWLRLCEQLRHESLYHRVCAAARLQLPFNWRTYSPGQDLGADARGDPFYNPHFRRDSGDYRLTPRPPHLPSASPPIVARVETEIHARSVDGNLTLRGWAFHLDGKPLRVEVAAGDLRWSSSCDSPRPDVARAHPAFSSECSGFSLALRLPAGTHPVSVAIVSPDAERLSLVDTFVHVVRFVGLHRALRASPAALLATQLFAGPSHAPRSLHIERFPRSRPISALPRLTIVTPSYQHARYLETTLRSVLDQNVACDYVVQDGGSSDGSVAIIERFASRLHSWESSRDAGQADAIRRAFARTSGEPADIMAWINSDDVYLAGALAYVQNYFAQHPEVDVLYGHRIVLDDASREIGRWFLPPHDEEILRLNDFVPQETLFWRRRLWDRVGGIDPSFDFALDWDLLLRFQAAGAKIVRVPYFLACFRVHPAQKTSAQMHTTGQSEIDALRRRTFGRDVEPAELLQHPALTRYLRHSARIEFLWRTLGLRVR